MRFSLSTDGRVLLFFQFTPGECNLVTMVRGLVLGDW